jgi:hypothetical protein
MIAFRSRCRFMKMSLFHLLPKRLWFWPLAIALLAAAAVMAALDPAGDHPGGWDGPGMTVDEAFNVAQGVQLIDRALAGDLAGFRTVDSRLPDHPPLGRLWIGACHEAAFLIWPPAGSQVPYSVACARTGSALAFAGTVFLIGWFIGRWFGAWAGGSAALAIVLMPRLFGHAHLAALESCIDFMYAAVVLFLADRWGESASAGSSRTAVQPPRSLGRKASFRSAAAGGILLGLALLTKIQAVLLPIPIALWTIAVCRKRAVPLLAVWGLVGGLVFLLAWPYLWTDPIAHIQRYLGRTTERSVIYAWYGGQAVRDRDLPWHYPWVLWGSTIPIGLLLLGGWGAWAGLRGASHRARTALVLACLAFPLLVFSIPGVAVYDGERLFSVSFPLWGGLVGIGADAIGRLLARRFSARSSMAVVAAVLAAQSTGLFVLAPCWLSYYNAAVAGLGGAKRLGLPISYWGDGLTRGLLAEVVRHVPRKSRIAVAPVLHPYQWRELSLQSPALGRAEIEFVPLGSPEAEQSDYLLFFPRYEYLPDEFRRPLDPDRVVSAIRRDGGLLAGLYKLR